MTPCENNLKLISPNDSFSSARERINSNFEGIRNCIISLASQINTNNNPTQLIFPDEPVNNQSYNILFTNSSWVVTESQEGSSGSKYHLLENETMTVKNNYQHIVVGDMILDAGANLIIEPEGALVIL